MRFFVRLRHPASPSLINATGPGLLKGPGLIDQLNAFRLARRCSRAPQVLSHRARLWNFRQRSLNLEISLQQHLISVLDAVRCSHQLITNLAFQKIRVLVHAHFVDLEFPVIVNKGLHRGDHFVRYLKFIRAESMMMIRLTRDSKFTESGNLIRSQLMSKLIYRIEPNSLKLDLFW